MTPELLGIVTAGLVVGFVLVGAGKLADARRQVRFLRADRLKIQHAICKTQCGGDGSEDDDTDYTVDEIVGHIELLDQQRKTYFGALAEYRRVEVEKP